jgi:hypothetical protein
MGASFEELIAEAAVPVDGWDFSWFAGRATEQRPSWGYARLVADRMAAALDIQSSVRSRVAVGRSDGQTGGGEVGSFVSQAKRVLIEARNRGE